MTSSSISTGFPVRHAVSGGLAIALLLLLPTSGPAQERDGCIVNLPGTNPNLNKLCGRGREGSSNPGSAGGSGIGSGPGSLANKRVFRAPIKRLSGRTPVIEVLFNGQRKFEMIVDTGADRSLITKSMAKALKIPIVGAGRFTLADGNTVTLQIGRLASMGVDGSAIRNVDVAIADEMDAGLLGHDFFGDYDVQFKKDVVEFRQRS
jgi:predicted aspartyl protease